jgi:hypothetical protein
LQGHDSNQVYKLVAKYTEFIESIKKSNELKPHLKKVYLNVNEEYKKLLEVKKQNDSFWRNTIIAISTILCGCGCIYFRKNKRKYKKPRIKNNKLSPSKPKPIKKTKKRNKQKSPQKKKPTPLLNKTYKHNNKNNLFATKKEPKNDNLQKYKNFATQINRILKNILNKKIKKPIMHLKIEDQQSVFTVAYHNDYKNYIPTIKNTLTEIKFLTWNDGGKYDGKRNHWYFKFTIPNNKLEACLAQISTIQNKTDTKNPSLTK